MHAGALHGIRVLDMSRVLAGPWAAQMLGDLGADVVKVERPEKGDDTRSWGPPWVSRDDGAPVGDSAYFTCANRNKRSMTVDIATQNGQEIVRAMACHADVLIENYKVGGLKQYGLDYEALSALNPRLIYCSITGFGQTGPYSHRPGYDFLVQGLGGLMSITGHPDETPGGGPMKVGVAVVDVMTGLNAAVAILAALHHRKNTGLGQHVDIALLDVQVAALANQAANFLVGKSVPSRMGNAHPNIVPYQDFPTADGYMILTVGNDSQFARFAGAAGHAEWVKDPRYQTNAARVQNRKSLVEDICKVTRTRTTDEWISELESAGVPCGPINDLGQVFKDPQVRARGMQVPLPGPQGGEVVTVASPLRLSRTPISYRYGPPGLGAHTEAVLTEWVGATNRVTTREPKTP